MTYEITAVALGATTTWTVEARSASEARRLAHQQLRSSVTNGQIVGVHPQGNRPALQTGGSRG